VNADLAQATMRDGVLEISMPMTKVEAKSRKLEIADPAPPTVTKAA
jgi:HSP20 family molecular chaperone IbpA